MLLLPSGPREALDLVEKQPPRPAGTPGGVPCSRDSSGVVLQLRQAAGIDLM